MANEYRVLKPIVYHGNSEGYSGKVVQPGAVLDFSHLTEQELDGLQSTMTIGPKDKKALEKKIKELEAQRNEKLAAIKKQKEDEKAAQEMIVQMKKAANLKQQIAQGKET